ncbi:MAG: branched-chain amino acid ABC transporter permease [Candidatus Rokubacteria bacterium]|nr:branched-chain amino acid ABC transporter permease [Candidatus Rokubacteria bacterium]
MNLVMPDFGFGLVTASILAMGAVAFTMLYGVTRVINFAFGDMMSVGAYLAWIFNMYAHWNVWVAAVASMILMGVFGVFMGRVVIAPFLRRGGGTFTLLIVTFAFGLILQNALQLFFGTNFQSYAVAAPKTVGFLGMVLTNDQVIVFAVALATMLVLHALLQYTKIGVAMRAMSDNVALARTCGINTALVSDLAWGIAGALSGLGGFVLALTTTSFGATIGANFLLLVVSAAVLGGVGRPYGAMLGALVVGVVTEMSVLVLPASDKTAVALIVLFLVLLLRPQGIANAVGRS